MRRHFVLRIRMLGALIVVGALILSGRLWMLQIVSADTFTERAELQYTNPGARLFNRGSIFFTRKTGEVVSAATMMSGFVLSINPSELKDPEAVYEALSKHVTVPRDVFFARASKTNDPYEELLHRISDASGKAIRDLNIPGVLVHRERWRYYPGNSLASHAIGFLSFDQDTLRGMYGIERYYEDTLTRDTDSAYTNFFAEVFNSVSDIITKDATLLDGDVVTGIEPNVQTFFEKTLDTVHTDYNSRETAGIIMDPTSGQIIAMAVLPNFDLNNFREANPDTFANPLVERVYEMGSIIKPLTMASAIDAKTITPETTYNDLGYITLDGYTISNFDKRGRGIVSMQEVLNQSLNTGVAFVVHTMGSARFADYMKRFGIGEETGIDLPNEVRGLIGNLDSPRAVEYATASFGQGIALSPIGAARALGALANGGVLVTPHVAQSIAYRSGFTNTISFPGERRVISKESAETVTRMLVTVVDTALQGGTVKKEHYSIAAKTGTAQIAKTDGRGYYDDRYLHSFFGYFPAYEPKFLIFIYTLEPKGVRYASETMTKPFMHMVDYLINYYEIPPDR